MPQLNVRRNNNILVSMITLTAAGACSVSTMSHAVVLEEILVTAQKREESLQDVPISVSALQGDALSSSGIQRFEDVSEYVPNFSVTRDPIGDKINIRGVQSGNQAGFEQSVGTFVDGIYRGRGSQARFAFMDVERVEVLRGPQGTLFGKNTIAGALNITSAKPSDEFGGGVTVGYNVDFEETDIQAHVTGSITDNIRGRLFVLDRQMDEGYVDNVFYDDPSPQQEEQAARLSLEWDVSDQTMISMRTEFGEFDVIGQPWEHASAGSLAAVGVEDELNYRTNMGATDPVLDFGSNGDLRGDFQETAITLESELTDTGTLTVVAGYSAYEFDRFLDADFAPINGLRFDDTEDFDQTSFEVRFTSDVNDSFSYIAGVFYQNQDLVVDGLTSFGIPTLQALLQAGCNTNLGALTGGAANYANTAIIGDAVGTATAVASTLGNGAGFGAAVANACGQAAAFDSAAIGPLAGVSRYARLDQETESYAAFFQGDIQLTNALELTLGIRFTNEEKTASQSVWAADYVERNTNETTSPLVAAIAQAAGEFTRHEYGLNDPGMTRDEESLTWSASLQWSVTADTLLYASASTGFKAGGFNSFYMGATQGLGADSRDVSFEEEEVLTFELGAKMTVWDGRGEINAAIFRTEFDDLQASIFTGGTTFVVQNAAQATSQGIEIDSRWAMTDELTLAASFGYIDFEFDEFPNQACTAEQFLAARQTAYEQALATTGTLAAGAASLLYNNGACAADGVNDIAGGSSENTPEFQAVLSANYSQAVFDSFQLDMTLDVNWRDEVYRQGDLDPLSLQGSQTKINASVTLGPDNDSWDVSLIGRNLTDEEEISYVNDTPLFTGTRQSLTGTPRSLSIRGRYFF